MTQKSLPKKIKSQASDDFKTVAKRLECDEDRARFEAQLGKIAKMKPTPAKLPAKP